jgi:hypothetical protein
MIITFQEKAASLITSRAEMKLVLMIECWYGFYSP